MFPPEENLTDEKIRKGMGSLLVEGVFSQGMVTLSSGAFLVGYALTLGATNVQIGVLSAIPFVTHLAQLPTVWFIEKARRRKLLAILSAAAARVFLTLIAFIPFLFSGGEVGAFIWLMVGLGVVTAFSVASFNSWVRDLVPGEVLGSFFARRMKLAIALSVPLSIGGGYFVDHSYVAGMDRATAYGFVFFCGMLVGLAELYYQCVIPERKMPESERASLAGMLVKPLKEKNFRTLVTFTSTWGFALNMVAPFFAVYMMTRLGLGLGLIMLITVGSHLSTVYFLPVWGRLADRYNTKSILKVGVLFYIVSFIAWPFVTLPEQHALTVPMLFAIHVLLGLANGCVSLGTNNLALKLSPAGTGTAHLAVNSSFAALLSGLAPLFGGAVADLFQRLELTTEFHVLGTEPGTLVLLSMRGLDFLFVIAIAFGFFALHRLSLIVEEGEVEERVVYQELISESKHTIRSLSTVPGFQFITFIPSQLLIKPVTRSIKNVRDALRKTHT